MRRKIHNNRSACRVAELLFNLRCMSVARDTVRLHILIDLTEQIRQLRTAPCAGGTGLRINDKGIRIDQPFLHQRICRQNRTGCVAARIGNQSGIFHFIAVHFAKAVHRLPDKLRALVLNLVPFLIHRNILDTEIRGQIDDLCLLKKSFV